MGSSNASSRNASSRPIELQLQERHEVARGTMAFRLALTGQEYPFRAGQYATFKIDSPQGPVEDRLCIASSPENRSTLLVATRMEPSDFTDRLQNGEPGMPVLASPARGDFVLPADTRTPLVMIAGGMGITPFRSMLKGMLDTDERRRTYLFYANAEPTAAAFLDELRLWQDRLPLTLVPTWTQTRQTQSETTPDKPLDGVEESGRIDDAMLLRHIAAGELHNAAYYISGPPDMMGDVAATVRGLGIADHQVHADPFAAP
jgi:ferredoxin-NADP reductase